MRFDDLAGRPFVEVIAAVVARLGPPPTVGDGPFARWVSDGQWLTVSRYRDGAARVDSEEAATAADEEYRDFEWSEIDTIPFAWRADVTSLLPDGTWFPGCFEPDDGAPPDDTFGRVRTVCCSIAQAVEWLPALRAGFDLVVTHPSSGRSAQWTVSAAPGGGQASALVSGPDGPRWQQHPLSDEGVRASLDVLIAELVRWDVVDLTELRQRSQFVRATPAAPRYDPTLIGLGLTAG